jgi:hypothetical protein
MWPGRRSVQPDYAPTGLAAVSADPPERVPAAMSVSVPGGRRGLLGRQAAGVVGGCIDLVPQRCQDRPQLVSQLLTEGNDRS